MEIELNVTLKGATVWKKGLILDDEKAPFPADILQEIKLNRGTVKIVNAPPAISRRLLQPEVETMHSQGQEQDHANPQDCQEKKLDEEQSDLLFRKLDEKPLPQEEVINIEDIAPDNEKKKVTRSDVFRMNKAALVAFINNEEKTTDKTNKELKEMVYALI